MAKPLRDTSRLPSSTVRDNGRHGRSSWRRRAGAASKLAVLLCLAVVASGVSTLTPSSLGGGLVGPTYPAYQTLPHAPPASARTRQLLRGSRLRSQGGWIVADLSG